MQESPLVQSCSNHLQPSEGRGNAGSWGAIYWLPRSTRYQVWEKKYKQKLQQFCGVDTCSVVCDFFVTLWTVACQAPLSKEFSRQEYWSGLPFPSPRDLLDPRIQPGSPTLQADFLLSEPQGNPLPAPKSSNGIKFHVFPKVVEMESLICEN